MGSNPICPTLWDGSLVVRARQKRISIPCLAKLLPGTNELGYRLQARGRRFEPDSPGHLTGGSSVGRARQLPKSIPFLGKSLGIV